MMKQKATQDAFNSPVIFRFRMAADGMTRKQREQFSIAENAHQEVSKGFENDSLRKLCELDARFKEAIIESLWFPLETEKKFPHLKGRPMIDKVAHLMADNVLVNLGVINTSGEEKEERQVLFKLLKDLGVSESDVVINTFSKRIPYTEDNTHGIMEVKVVGEYKNPEAVVYAKLYELYHKQLEKLGFSGKEKKS